MRQDWEIKSLDQIATVKGGKRVPKGYKFETTPTSHPYITVADFTEDGTVYPKNLKYISDEVYEQIKNYTISSQDIYISIAGTIGKTGSVPKSLDGANLTENACKLVLHRGIDKKFVYYFTKTDNFVQQTGINTRVAAQPKLALVRLKTITLPIPTFTEQKRIVAILDEAFEGIDRAIANTEKNLANSRELFESYLNAIFTQKGDGWVEKKLEDICSITSKLVDPRLPEYMDLPHVGAGNMVSTTGELIEVKTAREEELKSGKFLFDDTMVLYSKIRPYLMKACRPEFSGLCSADVYPLLPNNGQLNRDFLFYLLMSRNFTDYAISGSDRAGMPKVNRDHLFRYTTWIPSLSEQINTAQQIDEIASETQRLETIYRRKITALKELKQSILQKAFTGELTTDTSKIAQQNIAA